MGKKEMLLAIFVLGIGLTGLAGCGHNPEDAERANSVAFMKTSKNKQPQVWFKGELDDGEIHKDSAINDVLVTKNGKVTDYSMTNITFQQIKGKNNDQLIKLAKTLDKKGLKPVIANQKSLLKEQLITAKENLKEQQSSKKDWDKLSDAEKDAAKIGSLSDAGSPESIRDAQKQVNQYTTFVNQISQKKYSYIAPKTSPIVAYVNTDDNDKSVTAELLGWQGYTFTFPVADNNDQKDLTKLTHKADTTGRINKMDLNGIMGAPISILGDKYIGYYLYSENDDSQEDNFLITKTQNSKAKAQLDEAKTSGVKKTNTSLTEY